MELLGAVSILRVNRSSLNDLIDVIFNNILNPEFKMLKPRRREDRLKVSDLFTIKANGSARVSVVSVSTGQTLEH